MPRKTNEPPKPARRPRNQRRVSRAPTLRVVDPDEAPEAPEWSKDTVEFPFFMEAFDKLDIRVNSEKFEEKTLDELKELAQRAGIEVGRKTKAALIEELAGAGRGLRYAVWCYFLDTIGGPDKLKTKADQLAFGLGVDALVEYIEIERDIIIDGRFWRSKGRSGEQIKRHPGVEPMSAAWARVMGTLDRFGMNPAARGKVKQDDGDGADPERDAWEGLGQLA